MIFERRGGMAVGGWGGKGMGFGIYLWLFLEDSVDSIFFKKNCDIHNNIKIFGHANITTFFFKKKKKNRRERMEFIFLSKFKAPDRNDC